MTDAKKERYRRVRGATLKFLAHAHPGPLDSKNLYFLLDDIGYTMTEEEFMSHVAYLEEKGCIKKDTRRSGGMQIEMILITAHGLDVLDNFDSECGIDVRF